MRRSSKIVLGVCVVLLAYLLAVYIPIYSASKPDMTEHDARDMLTGLIKAFEGESVGGVLSFVAPDAKVAGRNLERIRQLLRQAFGYLQHPRVDYDRLEFARNRDTVALRFNVRVLDQTNASGAGDVVYAQPMAFVVKRIPTPHLLGLFTTYDWKITSVDAPRLPDEVPGLP